MRKTSDKRFTSKHKSIILHLREANKLDDSLLVLINNLTLEQLIALKLELSAKMINNRLYGLDIWRNSGYIVKEALLMFAISTTQSKITGLLTDNISTIFLSNSSGLLALIPTQP